MIYVFVTGFNVMVYVFVTRIQCHVMGYVFVTRIQCHGLCICNKDSMS